MEIRKSNKQQKIVDGFIWLILMGLMTFSITYMFVYALIFTYSPIRLASVTLIILSILSIIFLNKYTTRITFGLLVIALAAGSIYLYKKDLLELVGNSLISRVTTFSQWALSCIQGHPVTSSNYIHYFTILLCTMIACVVYFFTVKKFSFLILFLAGTFAFVFEVVQSRAMNHLALYIFIFTSLVYFFKSRYVVLKKQLDENNFATYKAFMKMSICLGLGICIGAMVLSQNYPYKAQWIHDIAEKLARQEYYYEVEGFSVKSAGLQEDNGLLGGDISPNSAIVLVVDTPDPIYLKAVSRDSYTGNAWISEEQEAAPIDLDEESLEDTMEALQAFKWISGEDDSLETMFVKQTAEISFVNMSTKSLFIPSKIESLNIISTEREVFLTGLDMLSLKNTASKNFTYTAEFYEPRVTHDDFKEILRKSKRGYYTEIIKEHSADSISINKWAERAEVINAKYTQLPEELPERISELAYTITEQQDTDYDKVKALEEYLAVNYSYTLTPGMPDENKDFVDAFLFEDKQGYCTYFASALAVLTRGIGLPARYVEGYSLPTARDSSKNVYVVTNQRAHAWVEVYFEGIGWIIFEATPPYRQSETVDQAHMSMEEAMRNAQEVYTSDNNLPIFNPNEAMPQTYAGIIISMTIMLLGLMSWYLLRKYKYRKMEPRAATLFLYSYYLGMLASCNLRISKGETEAMFAARIDEQMFFLQSNFKEITHLFLVARYSQQAITHDEKQMMMDFRHILLKATKRKLNRLKYMKWRIRNKLF